MRLIGPVLVLGVVLTSSAASGGSLAILVVDAVSGRLLPDAIVTYVYLGNEYWDRPASSRNPPGYALDPGDYEVTVAAPGYKETSLRVFLTAMTARMPFIVRMEKASSDPQERHPAKQR